jgi:negative regulator of sigma E activity
MNDAIKMQISAFIDDELPDNESELLLRRLSHDADLRQQAAEYFAVGRAMRGQRSVPGLSKLRERVWMALDDSSVQVDFDAIEPAKRSYLRPVAGVAIAATVAMAAILGLQQFEDSPAINGPAIGTIAAKERALVPVSPGYTVPTVYHELHREGASNINARLATFRMLEDEIDELPGRAEDANVPQGDDSDAQRP